MNYYNALCGKTPKFSRVLSFSIIFIFANIAYGQTAMSKWQLTADGTPNSVATNVSATNFVGGSGIGTITFASTGARSSGWPTGALSSTDYYEITILPNAGYDLTINEILFGERRTSSGIRDYQVRWSKDAFATSTTIATVNVPDDANERSGDITGLSIFVGNTETLYIRFYGYTAESSSGSTTWRINNATLELVGSVASACTTPTNQANSASPSAITATTASLSWTKGAGSDGSIVVLNKTTAPGNTPSNGTTYTANAAYGSGDALGASQDYIIFQNTSGTSVNITALVEASDYHYAIYDYMTTDNCYKLSSPETGVFTTTCTSPTAVNSESIEVLESAELYLSWVLPTCYSNIVVVAKEGSAPTTTFTAEDPSTFIGTSSVFGTAGSDVTSVAGIAGKTNEFIVYNGTNTSINITGLENGKDYYFEIFTYNSTWTNNAVSPDLIEKAVDLIGCQTFEDTLLTPVLEIASLGTSSSTSDNGLFPNDPKYASDTIGQEVNNETTTIEFESIDATGYSNYTFRCRLASFAGTSGNGADVSDYVRVFVSTDGGTTWSQELEVTGRSNARWSFATGTGEATSQYDGNNTIEGGKSFDPVAGGDRTTDGYSTIKLSSLPNVASLAIKLELKNNSVNEFWVIDDADLYGVPAAEIDVYGNSLEIENNDVTASRLDDTYFGTVDLTTGTITKTFTIENLATEILNISGSSPYVTISGTNAADFSVSTAPSNTVASGASTTFQILFDPASGTPALHTATLTINSDDPDEAAYSFDIEGRIANSCVEPTNPPTSLILTPQITSAQGSFTGAVGATLPTGYLVVVYPSGASTTAPIDGQFYERGDALGSGTIVEMTTTTSFTAYGLGAISTNDFYVYSYTHDCAGEADYNTTALSGTTTTSSVTIDIVTGAIGPSTIATRADATALNNAWETLEKNKGVTCSSGWVTKYGDLSFPLGTAGPGTITNLVQTNILSGSGTGTAYAGTVNFTLNNFSLDPNNALGGEIIDNGAMTLPDNNFHGVKTNSTKLQDKAPSPDGVDEYFTSSKYTSGRSGLEFTMSIAVDNIGFFLGDVETTTANNGSSPFTAAVVVSYDASGNELERKIIPTATPGGNCVSNSTSGSSSSCGVGCGSVETTWINVTSSTANIAKVRVIVGDYVDQIVTSGCSGSLNRSAGKDRGKNEHVSFGGFTLGGNCATPLPVDLIEFTGSLNDNGFADLSWKTASELNNSHFEIERSDDLKSFYKMGTVTGAGNSNEVLEYTFTDSRRPRETVLYRLKQVDYDGKSSYSDVIQITPVSKHNFILYPNPSTGDIKVANNDNNIEKIEVVDILGMDIYSTSKNLSSFRIDAKPGLYWVLITTKDGTIVRKSIVIQ